MLLLLALCFSVNISANKQTKAELDQLNKELSGLQKLLTQFKKQRSNVENSLQKTELHISELEKKIYRTSANLAKKSTELKGYQQEQQALQQKKNQQQEKIAEQIRTAYQLGQSSKLVLLLNQEEPEKLSRALTYLDYFNMARTKQIALYTQLIDEINSLSEKIISTTEQLNNSKKQLEANKQSLIASQQARKKQLQNIDSNIKNKDREAEQLKKQRAELEKVLQAINVAINNIKIPKQYQDFKNLRGKLPAPIAAARASNRFKGLRDASGLRWQGLNLPARKGTEVRSIHNGRVVFADWLRGMGLLVIVDHGNNYLSLYGHNNTILVNAGDWVQSGEKISTVGNSGGRKQYALYFELRHKGKPINPYKWCKIR